MLKSLNYLVLQLNIYTSSFIDQGIRSHILRRLKWHKIDIHVERKLQSCNLFSIQISIVRSGCPTVFCWAIFGIARQRVLLFVLAMENVWMYIYDASDRKWSAWQWTGFNVDLHGAGKILTIIEFNVCQFSPFNDSLLWPVFYYVRLIIVICSLW
jgi:hypothetical protein